MDLTEYYLSSTKLELIKKYLDDQIKLVKISSVGSVCSSTSEASPSPVTTPIIPPESATFIPVASIQNHFSDNAEIYRTFALPLCYNLDSTEERTVSQKSQGFAKGDLESVCLPAIRETFIIDKLNETYRLPPIQQPPINSDQVYHQQSQPMNIHSLSGLNLNPNSKREADIELSTTPLDEQPSKMSKLSKRAQDRKDTRLSKFLSHKLSTHRITLPKLGQTMSNEVIRKYLKHPHFSEKDLLGLDSKERQIKINRYLAALPKTPSTHSLVISTKKKSEYFNMQAFSKHDSHSKSKGFNSSIQGQKHLTMNNITQTLSNEKEQDFFHKGSNPKKTSIQSRKQFNLSKESKFNSTLMESIIPTNINQEMNYNSRRRDFKESMNLWSPTRQEVNFETFFNKGQRTDLQYFNAKYNRNNSLNVSDKRKNTIFDIPDSEQKILAYKSKFFSKSRIDDKYLHQSSKPSDVFNKDASALILTPSDRLLGNLDELDFFWNQFKR